MSRTGDSKERSSAPPSGCALCLHAKWLNEKPILFLTGKRTALELEYRKGGLERNERPMLPPFIIEQIRKREEEERRRQGRDQPRLELPLDVHRPAAPTPRDEDNDTDVSERGIVILDLLGDDS